MEENYKVESELLARYRAGLCSEEEMLLVDHWFNQQAKDIPDHFEGSVLQDIRKEIWAKLPAAQETKKYKLWPGVAIAAAVSAIVFGMILFYYNQNFNAKQPGQVVAGHDVAPGRSGATLTLADGTKIKLTDAANGQLAKQSGVTITKSAKGQLMYSISPSDGGLSGGQNGNEVNTLTTARGETYQVRLPDGSQVWLNAASSLKYPANFGSAGSRRVQLTGEAYFQVAKDKAHPFVVRTGNQEVEVLGTHFNVNSYADEPAVTTTLIEGLVKVTSGSNQQLIKPGQQAINNGNAISVKAVNLENIMDWKNGDFNLNRVDFKLAMRKIARWYDVEVVYDPSVPEDFETVGWVSRDRKLSSVLKSIESMGIIRFKVEGRKIYVSRMN